MDTNNLTPAQIKATENGGTNNAVIGNSLVKRGIMADTGKGLHEYRFSITDEWIAYVTGETVETVRDFAAALDSMDEEQKIAAIIEDAAEDARYAEEIGKEEAEADKHAGEYERAQIERENEADRDAQIEALREEFETADANRCEEIIVRLAQLDTVVYPEGSPEYADYGTRLNAELVKFYNNEPPYDIEPVKPGGMPTVESEAASAELFGRTCAEKTVYAVTRQENGTLMVENGDIEVRFAEAVDADDSQAQQEILNAVAPEVVTLDFKGSCDPKETRYSQIERWTGDNLEVKYGILRQRLGRRTLLKSDRQQAERHCQIVENELLRRDMRYVLEAYAKRS